MFEKLPLEEHMGIIKQLDVKSAFMKRSDIMSLPLPEQEKRFKEHMSLVQETMRQLAELPSVKACVL